MKKAKIVLLILIILSVFFSNIYNSKADSIEDFLQSFTIVAVYVPYSDSSDGKIGVAKYNGSYRFVLSKKKLFWNSGTEITISNLNDYIAAFDSGDVNQYPTWINEKSKGVYEFSKTKDENSKTNYISQQKIANLSGQTGSNEETCETLFGTAFLNFLNNNVFTVVRIAIPLLLVLFTTFDFAKVVFIDDKEGIQKAGKRFGKRLVASILVFLIPQILIWLANIIGADKVNECAEWMQNNQSEINDIYSNE